MKVTVMGQELTREEVDAIEEPMSELEAYFTEPTVSPNALDATSRVVPEDVWHPLGLHTWLTQRAAAAFKRLPVSRRSIEIGRLRYVFEYQNDKPVLKTVVLLG